jgi:hypothetical protein
VEVVEVVEVVTAEQFFEQLCLHLAHASLFLCVSSSSLIAHAQVHHFSWHEQASLIPSQKNHQNSTVSAPIR